MCNFCSKTEGICPVCGSVQHPDWSVVPYKCLRRDIKRIADTCDSDTFVWALLKDSTVVKIGCGTLKKLFNETKPNPKYIRFDSVVIYWLKDLWERNELATLLCGLHADTVVNRQAWRNYTYCKASELIMPPGQSDPVSVFGDPDFKVGDVSYWDIRKLQRIGVDRRRICL